MINTMKKWIDAIGGLIHWLTGWIVHPKDGGCCKADSEDVVDDFKNLLKK